MRGKLTNNLISRKNISFLRKRNQIGGGGGGIEGDLVEDHTFPFLLLFLWDFFIMNIEEKHCICSNSQWLVVALIGAENLRILLKNCKFSL